MERRFKVVLEEPELRYLKGLVRVANESGLMMRSSSTLPSEAMLALENAEEGVFQYAIPEKEAERKRGG